MSKNGQLATVRTHTYTHTHTHTQRKGNPKDKRERKRQCSDYTEERHKPYVALVVACRATSTHAVIPQKQHFAYFSPPPPPSLSLSLGVLLCCTDWCALFRVCGVRLSRPSNS